MNNAQMTACVYTHTHDRTLKARAGVAPHERAYIDETGERRRGSQRSYNAVERGSARKQTAVLCALLHNENLTPKAVAV